jgi:hypothetical protein
MSSSRLTLVIPVFIVVLVALTPASSAAVREAPPTNTSPPTISGTAQAGQTLTANPGSWSSTQPLNYAYQWQRCDSAGNNCVSVAGATAQTYLLTSSDVGSTMRVRVTASSSKQSRSATSAQTSVVTQPTSAVAPSLVSPPIISGTAQEGQTLSSSTGTWNSAEPIRAEYRWFRCDTSGGNCVAGPTGMTYLLVSTDVGKTFRVVVTAFNSAGSATGTSAATAVVVAASSSAPQCSRSSLSSCPASYFTGPLGNNNLIPAKPGAFLIEMYGASGMTWAQAQAGLLQREQDIGRKFDGIGVLYNGGSSWGGVYGMPDPTSFTPRVEQWIHDNGSFPLITWTPNYTISQMNNGTADAIWAKAANYFKSYPFTIMVRAFSEFDGPFNTYSAVPWSGNGNVNSCGAPFIAAWQRMVNIFKANGATNVGFWWVPEEGVNRTCVNVSYPGDAYVDWVGSDWFNVCLVGDNRWCSPLHPGWSQFSELFNYTSACQTACTQHDLWGPHKPFVIGETGTWYDSNYPSYKGDWFRNIPAAAKNMRYLRGIEFYDQDARGVEEALNDFMVDYPTSNASVYAGYKALAADPWFNTG